MFTKRSRLLTRSGSSLRGPAEVLKTLQPGILQELGVSGSPSVALCHGAAAERKPAKRLHFVARGRKDALKWRACHVSGLASRLVTCICRVEEGASLVYAPSWKTQTPSVDISTTLEQPNLWASAKIPCMPGSATDTVSTPNVRSSQSPDLGKSAHLRSQKCATLAGTQ